MLLIILWMLYEGKNIPVFPCLYTVQDNLLFISALEVHSLAAEYACRQSSEKTCEGK